MLYLVRVTSRIDTGENSTEVERIEVILASGRAEVEQIVRGRGLASEVKVSILQSSPEPSYLVARRHRPIPKAEPPWTVTSSLPTFSD